MSKQADETCSTCHWYRVSGGGFFGKKAKCECPLPPMSADFYQREPPPADYWCVLWRRSASLSESNI